MGITAQAGIFGFGIQADGAKAGAVATWYRHKAAGVDLAAADDVRMGPPEIGGKPVPTLAYKAGYAAGGGATIYPRMKGTFGHLLLALMGASATVTGKDINNVAHAGLNWHTFKFATAQTFVPYIAMRKLIPHDVAATELGEIFTDGKLISTTLSFSSEELITARLDTVACDYSFLKNPAATWVWNNTYEDEASILSGSADGGLINLTGTVGGSSPGTDMSVVAATCTMANIPLDLRQEKVYGSPKLRGVTVVGRSMSFDLVVQWEDPDLYLQLLAGSAAGTTWVPKPSTAKVVIEAVSPENIGAAPLDVPYRLRVTASKVLLRQVGGISLAPNQTVMMRLAGTAMEPASGEFATLEVQNVNAAYTIPTA